MPGQFYLKWSGGNEMSKSVREIVRGIGISISQGGYVWTDSNPRNDVYKQRFAAYLPDPRQRAHWYRYAHANKLDERLIAQGVAMLAAGADYLHVLMYFNDVLRNDLPYGDMENLVYMPYAWAELPPTFIDTLEPFSGRYRRFVAALVRIWWRFKGK